MTTNLKRTKVYFLVIACFMACMLILCSYKFNGSKIYKFHKADVRFRVSVPKAKGKVQNIYLRSIFSNNINVTIESLNHTTEINDTLGPKTTEQPPFRVKLHDTDPNSTSLLTRPRTFVTTIAKKDQKSENPEPTKTSNGTYDNDSDNGTVEKLPDIPYTTGETFNKSIPFESTAKTSRPNDSTKDKYFEKHTVTARLRENDIKSNNTKQNDKHFKNSHVYNKVRGNKHRPLSNLKSSESLKQYLLKLGLPHHIMSQISFGQSSGMEGTVRPDVCTNCFKNDFKAILDVPDLCQGDVFILIAISSTVSKRASRDAIRNTWGSACNNQNTSIKCLFMFGKSKTDSENQDLVTESNKYHDIAQFDFLDTYANLTYKTMTSMKWVVENCPDAVYVMKTDDDMFVNTELLPILLQAAPSENFMGGVCWGPSPPHRDRKSKWYVSFQQYTRSAFPPMCSGTGYVFSSDIIPNILTQSRNIPFFYLEDVYIALCLKKMGVRPLRVQGFYNTLVEFDPCNYRNRVITSHGLNHFDLSTIWRSAQSCELEELTPSMLYVTRPL